jgi:hypothetical protein
MGSYDNFGRRRSFSGGFAPSNGLPPHTEAVFRPGRDFNEFGHTEVSGPPNHPPPNSAFGRSVPNNMNTPNNFPPPPPPPQSYSSGPGSFPPSGGMGSSFPMGMGTREQNSFPGFDSSPGMNPTGIPPPPGPAYPNSYDGSPLSDNQFPPLDDGGFTRGRSLSAGGGFGPPALMPPPGPMTPFPSNYGHPKRTRRASSVGPGMGMGYGVGGYAPEMYHRPGGRVTIKFRLKGETHSGISVAEALNRERLSQGQGYMMHDIAPDMLGRITLKVRVSYLALSPPYNKLI